MTDLKRLQSLERLTAASLTAAQSEVAGVLKKETDLRLKLKKLDSDRQIFGSEGDTTTPAMRAGAAIRWQQWADTRRAAINSELAQVLAHKLACQRRLRRVFGKNHALQELVKRQQQALRQKRVRSNS